MKRFFVVLLILTVAGRVFAQRGYWSLRGKVETGTLLNFKNDPVTVKGQAYDDSINSALNIGYTLNLLRLGIDFNINNWSTVNGWLYYDTGKYVFTVETDLIRLMNSKPNVNRLWGYYKMLNEIITLEAAYNSRDSEFWISDKFGAFSGYPVGGPWPGGDTFTKQDHGNYLLTNVRLSNLSFGVKLPNLFSENAVELLDDVIKKAVFGLKFNVKLFEVAAQFKMVNYGVYVGSRLFIRHLTACLSFQGIFDPDAESKMMKFGGGVEYYPGVFGVNFKAYYGISRKDSNNCISQIGIEPFFFYDVIPSHMRFQTDVGLYFLNVKNDGIKKDLEIACAVKPQLFWNFLGTGAGGCSTGMIVRYTLVAGDNVVIAYNNALDFTFRFSF